MTTVEKAEWRPKGWQNPWPKGKYINELECEKLRAAYEAGASAMLTARLQRRKRNVVRGNDSNTRPV